MSQEIAMHTREHEARPPEDQGPAKAFPIALVVAGLVLVVATLVLVFIWVAARDEPTLNRSPRPNAPTAAIVQPATAGTGDPARS
jgi:hypothetical protein